jgi:phage recombination protein Bet
MSDAAKQVDTNAPVETTATAQPLTTVITSPAPLARVETGPVIQPWQPMIFSDQVRELLRKQFAPSGANDLEFEFFMKFCQRTGLDPLLKQAFFVERRSEVDGQWVTKFEPMASEAGMAARADSLPDNEGIIGAAVYEGDEFAIDWAERKVIHRSTPLKRGKLTGAWALAKRRGRSQPPTYLLWNERAQTTKKGDLTRFWSKMGPGMLLKCARAEQWRQAWPNLFGGVYIREEFDDETGEVIDLSPQTGPDHHQAEQARAASTTDALEQRLAAERERAGVRPGAHTVEGKVVDVKVDAPPATQPTQAPAQAPATTSPAPQAPPAELGPHGFNLGGQGSCTSCTKPASDPIHRLIVYGPKKGAMPEQLSGPELLENVALGTQKLPGLTSDAKSSAEVKRAKVQACIDHLLAEKSRRDQLALSSVAPAAAPREPGEDLD